jgi:cyclopropane-fatty-acyl-phospholipid synthase
VSRRPAAQASRLGTWLNDRFRRVLLKRLQSLRGGRLVLEDAGQRHEFGTPGDSPLAARVEVRDPRFYRTLALDGSLGAGVAYLEGLWDCDDLVALFRMFCRNPEAMQEMQSGPARLFEPLWRMAHWLRRNTLKGSKQNIVEHYDQGEDFFLSWLDPTTAYSCGIFLQPDSTLRDASLEKLDRICRKLDLKPEHHVLDIGSGWGSFIFYAAEHYGCRTTGITISPHQLEHCRRLIRQRGLEDRVDVFDCDYRKVEGQFDKVVSVEMIENVGIEYLDDFFRVCSDRLKPGGQMLLQTITIPDQRFKAHIRGLDFVQHYIFPGGCLPSLGAMCGSIGRATQLQVLDVDDLTPHYPRTLAGWRRNFLNNRDRFREAGFREEFLRMWEYYFCYCQAGFSERMIGDVQMLMLKV